VLFFKRRGQFFQAPLLLAVGLSHQQGAHDDEHLAPDGAAGGHLGLAAGDEAGVPALECGEHRRLSIPAEPVPAALSGSVLPARNPRRRSSRLTMAKLRRAVETVRCADVTEWITGNLGVSLSAKRIFLTRQVRPQWPVRFIVRCLMLSKLARPKTCQPRPPRL
jgi:hypothetical protein